MSGERRGFFRDLIGRLGRLTGEVLEESEHARPTFVPPPHAEGAPPTSPRRRARRPPGAIDEAAFLSACTRCGDCVKVCPEGTIAAGEDGYPWADVERHPCALCVDVPCAAACATGALVHGPVIAFGTARVGVRLCLNHGRFGASRGNAPPVGDERNDPNDPNDPNGAIGDDDEEPPCERCVDWCPVPGAITLGEAALPVVDAARCNGCGACAAHCAAYPRAIAIA